MDAKNDIIRDIRISVMLLTRLPVPAPLLEDGETVAKSAWAFPVAGIALAILAGSLASLSLWLGLPPLVAAGLALGALIIASGAMHEDGLADCADGFWGGWETTRRLEIMRDSRVGVYGVLALVIGTGLRWTTYGALFASGAVFGPLLVAAALSRAAMLYVMESLPNARDEGLSQSTGRPGQTNVLIACAIALLVSILAMGWTGIVAFIAAAAAAGAAKSIARVKIGGQTGDVLGATQQVSEIAVLTSLAALL